MSNHEPKDLQMEQMPVTEILECLKDYGCEDLTEEVDMSTVSVTVEAQGGVGDIWKAKLKKGTDIAIKVRRSFAASDRDTGVKGEVYELYNWSQTHHENIHKLLGVMIFRGRLGMVSQWMENGDLKEYLEENETMDRYQMCLQVVKAVQYLHNEDMVHGDLKACNFLVSAEGVLKLNDFDHMVALEGDTVTFEPGDQIGGTLRWMAPELVVQTPHPRVMSKQSDIYALGMELTSGSIPYVFQCRNDLQMYSILGRKTLPTRTDNFDNQEGDIMWRLLMRCWDYNPAARPTVNEVHDTMQSLVNDLPQLRRNNLLPTPAANGQDDIRLDDSQVLELTNMLGQASSYEFSSAANTANEDASGSPPLVPQNERDALLPLSVHCAPDISKVAEELAEISLLRPSIDCLKVIFNEVDQLAVNKKRWELLRGRCVMVMRIIGAQIENREQNTSPELGSAVNTLREALERIVQRVHKYNEMNDMTAFLQLQAMNDEIRAHFTELDSCLNILSYSTDVTRSQWVNEWSAINKEFLPAMEMFQCLVRQDYPDLSSKIDLKAASSLAVTTGFYEDLWKGKLNDDTDVAIKVQRFHIETENYRQSFKRALREVYNWSRVDHKNVHKLLGVVMFEGQLGMVSRWMEHGNLREYIRVREPTDRYQLCVQAAKAVQHLHHINLVHGDLKCHKYLVSSDGVIELTDFDRSMVLEHDLLFPQATNRRGGNLRWMAPELIMGTPNSERRSKQADIYALGMTMLEIVTGDIPYASQRQGGGLVYSKVVQKMLPERTETFRDQKGGRLWELLVQCWDHDPALRPSADQVLGSLEHLCNETP